MLNGTNLTLNSDLALVSTQVKTLLYIVGQKARESFDTSMSTCDGVRQIQGNWKINKTLALLTHRRMKCICGSRGGGGTGGLDHPRKSQKYRSFSNTGPDPLKIVKLPSQLSIFGHNRLASKTPFQWRFIGGPKMAP